VQEQHYGLALAKVVPLPQRVIDVAEQVAQRLEGDVKRRQKTSPAVIRERRRKLLLTLKEHLVQAYQGTMEGEVLASWLKQLQKEFIKRMTAIEVEVAEAEEEMATGDDGDGDVEMGDESTASVMEG
jgi:DNA mismatch repair protein MSH4